MLGRETEQGQLQRYTAAINRICRATLISTATFLCHSPVEPTDTVTYSLPHREAIKKSVFIPLSFKKNIK